MSEASQPVEPDLHAIFGLDGEQHGDSAVSLDRDGAAGRRRRELRPVRRPTAARRRVEVELDGSAADGGQAASWDAEPPAPDEAPPSDGERRAAGRGHHHAVAARLLVALPDRRDRRAAARHRAPGHGRDRDLAHRRHLARADPARPGRDHRRRPRPRARRALRPRPPRPRRLPGRHVGRQPDHHDGRASATRRCPVGVRRQAHAARRDGRPVERARGRRHRDHDRPRGPRRGRAAATTSTR